MNALPEDNFQGENLQGGENLFSQLPFDSNTLGRIAENYNKKESRSVSQFVENIQEKITAGLSVEELVGQVVAAALAAEFGPGFNASPGNNRIAGAISKVIGDDPDLLERVVAVALKSYIEKNKKIN